MNQNCQPSDDRQPPARQARYEPLWRYQDLAPALPAEAADDEAESQRHPRPLRTPRPLPAARRRVAPPR